jgi:hypothetical protein
LCIVDLARMVYRRAVEPCKTYHVSYFVVVVRILTLPHLEDFANVKDGSVSITAIMQIIAAHCCGNIVHQTVGQMLVLYTTTLGVSVQNIDVKIQDSDPHTTRFKCGYMIRSPYRLTPTCHGSLLCSGVAGRRPEPGTRTIIDCTNHRLRNSRPS